MSRDIAEALAVAALVTALLNLATAALRLREEQGRSPRVRGGRHRK
ncbi:MAG: hypothetical protein ACTH3R_15695 [Brevibacterium aurantiacum]|nr:hypothetical protein [Brevibacterium sp.]MDN5654830.1 hypothetical protein [Kocuria sp.]